MTIRNRITELRYVRAGDLRPNPKNWRKHPKAQRQAVQAVLDEVGYADALIVREVDGTLELLDGHLRADLTPDATVAGSGSQLIAAEQLNRACYAMEIAPGYVDAAVKR